ncbi:hypothetical protein V492_00785 [Pseudogymnoascus sp. VKM F-4246]|nr:hypothetical protein V492_00785 [Pseudogymnoascus sp. VKM F-4246]
MLSLVQLLDAKNVKTEPIDPIMLGQIATDAAEKARIAVVGEMEALSTTVGTMGTACNNIGGAVSTGFNEMKGVVATSEGVAEVKSALDGIKTAVKGVATLGQVTGAVSGPSSAR